METDQRLVARREFRAAALRGHLPCLSILASLLSSRCPLVRKRVFRLALLYFWKNYPAGTVGEFSNTPLRLFSSCLTSLCHAARCLLAIRPPSSTALSQSPQNCYCSTLLPVPQPSHPPQSCSLPHLVRLPFVLGQSFPWSVRSQSSPRVAHWYIRRILRLLLQ